MSRQFAATSLALMGFLAVAGCTVEPLNPKVNSSSGPGVATNKLSNVEISPVSTRVAQQVRNQLVFSINGGGEPANTDYSVTLNVTSFSQDLSVLTQTQSPTSAQVTVTASYTVRSSSEGRIIGSGTRRAIASYDRTTQSFANQRAERDAENRAAKELAQLLQYAIAAHIEDPNPPTGSQPDGTVQGT
ncbi:MAG: LPS assembly lipoprotein LptE [Pseudomonadota bacterium]